jgi:hypothetical protein
MDIKKFAEKMTQTSNIKIDFALLREWIERVAKQLSDVIYEIEDLLNFEGDDQITDKEIASLLNLANINRATIEAKIAEEPNNAIYPLIIKMKELTTKLQALENVKKNANNSYIKPKFTVNTANKITVAEPALARLTDHEIKATTKYWTKLEFNTFEELYSFLVRFGKLIEKREGESNFIVVGLKLFTNLRYYGAEAVEIEFNRKNVTTENYKEFEGIYNKLYPLFYLTKECIETGYMEEMYPGTFPYPDKDSPDYMDDITEHIEYERRHIQAIERMYAECLKFKEQEGAEIETKTEEKTENNIEKPFIKVYDYEKLTEKMIGYGWTEDVIQSNIDKLKAVEQKTNENYYKDNIVIVGEEPGNETSFAFMLVGRQKLVGVRAIPKEKDEEGNLPYSVQINKAVIKMIAPKGSLHKTLILEFPDGQIVEVKGKNKKDNIKTALTIAVNHIIK